MRRYDDPVDVRRGRVPGPGSGEASVERLVEGPEQFLWQGRLWKVHAVLAQWVETGPWWHSSGAHAVLGAEDWNDGDLAGDGDRAAVSTLTTDRATIWPPTWPPTWPPSGRSGASRPVRVASADRPRRLRPGLRLGRRRLAAHPVPGLKEDDTPCANQSLASDRSTSRPRPTPTSARAADSLREAMTTADVPRRYACAHVAALRATAALLAARATPVRPPRRGRQKNAWVLLAEVAPELGEWASFFAAGAAKRAAAEAGSRRAVTEREADDLVRDADRFLGLVEESLGMTSATSRSGRTALPGSRRPGTALTLPDPFVHLHVASGYSLQYGASHPHVLVERAAEQEMDILALTDRDGAYGAVRFTKACLQGGIRPVLGVDLAVAPTLSLPGQTGHPAGHPGRSAGRPERTRTPVRGGVFRDDQLPRVTFLAGSRRGWAAVCRLVSATHLAGERGQPVSSARPGRRARLRPGRRG